MNDKRAVVLFVDGCEEEVRLISVPHRDGYAYVTRDGRVVACGKTGAEAYRQLPQASEQISLHVRANANGGGTPHASYS